MTWQPRDVAERVPDPRKGEFEPVRHAYAWANSARTRNVRATYGSVTEHPSVLLLVHACAGPGPLLRGGRHDAVTAGCFSLCRAAHADAGSVHARLEQPGAHQRGASQRLIRFQLLCKRDRSSLRQVRERSGAPMHEVKSALVATSWDIGAPRSRLRAVCLPRLTVSRAEAALEELRSRGHLAASKKARASLWLWAT